MYKVGVTGGIGSGKSTVCRLFAERGVAVYDSDTQAKRLMEESEALRAALVGTFGEECYADGRLNRRYLAARVFGDAAALARLNALVHPAVREDFRAWAERQSGPYVILESAILFEAGFENEVDTTLAVLAPAEERIKRCMERDGASREEVLRRMANQADDDTLHRLAARTIVNIRRDYLESDVERLHEIYSHEAQR